MLIDSHCHLPHEKYDKSIDEILIEAKSYGVEKLVSIGTSLEESKKAIDIAEKYPEVYCSVGIYPHDDRDKDLSKLEESLDQLFTKSTKIIGIGECGMDISNWAGGRNLEDQIEIFEMQLKFAEKNNLPVIIHNRNGDEYVLKMLKNHSGVKGVAHGFRSTWETAKGFLDLGFYISFAANISYPSNNDLREILKKVPDSMFLIETDSPYLPPQGHRGEINYPKYVKIVGEKVAQVKQKTFEEISELSYRNTCNLFNL
jgi:TatD DNase family protein